MMNKTKVPCRFHGRQKSHSVCCSKVADIRKVLDNVGCFGVYSRLFYLPSV
jgi:hypothetical protein